MLQFDHFDEKLLRTVDRVVLYTYNEFDVSRKMIIRILIVIYTAFSTFNDVFRNGRTTWSNTGTLVVFFIIFLLGEMKERRMSIKRLNANLLTLRESPSGRRIRLLVLAICVICTSLQMSYARNIGNVFSMLGQCLTGVSYLYFTYALQPEGPRNPKMRKSIFALSFG